MAQWLKQSTAVTVKMGPFLDEGDGKTAETELVIAQADIRVTKNGGDAAQTSNAAGASHDESGWYDVPLDTTDTGTLGRLTAFIHKVGALPVWQDFMVMPANVWDSMFGTDYLRVKDDEGNTLANESKQDTIHGIAVAIQTNTDPLPDDPADNSEVKDTIRAQTAQVG